MILGVKKPAGNAEEVEKHFGCASSQLVLVGDRLFTDIVYGNRNGYLTVLTERLTRDDEPFIRQVRTLEMILLNRWLRRGLKHVDHNLLCDAMQCVMDKFVRRILILQKHLYIHMVLLLVYTEMLRKHWVSFVYFLVNASLELVVDFDYCIHTV